MSLGTIYPLDHTYAGYSVQLKPQGNDQTLLVWTNPANPQDEGRILIDTARNVVLRAEHFQNGKITSTTTASDFVQVAGVWWAGRVESINADKKRMGLTTRKFTALEAGGFDRLWKQEMAGRDQVQLLSMPLPSLDQAKRALAEGKTKFEDHMVLMVHFWMSQQWDRVFEHLDKAEKLAAGKPGLRWFRSSILNQARRRDEVKTRYLEEAAKLAKSVPATNDTIFLTSHLVGQSSGIFEANEMMSFLDVLRPVYENQPAHLHAVKGYKEQRANYLEQTGQRQEALALRKQLAQDYPRDYNSQYQYVQALVRMGEYEAGYAWLERVLSADSADVDGRVWPGLLPHEKDGLRSQYAEMLRTQGRYDDLVKYLAEWVKRNPPSAWPYQQYLGALVRSDKADEADRLVADWLKDGRRSGELPPDDRRPAACRRGAGTGPGPYRLYQPDRRALVRALGEAALFFARHPSQNHLASQIMGQSYFQQSDECRRVRKAAAGILQKEIDRAQPRRDCPVRKLDLVQRSGRGA